MTDQTPQTEAGRRVLDLLGPPNPDHCESCAEEYGLVAAIEAQARAEGLDVEVLAQAYANVEGAGEWTPDGRIASAWVYGRVANLAMEYRAILAARRDEG